MSSKLIYFPDIYWYIPVHRRRRTIEIKRRVINGGRGAGRTEEACAHIHNSGSVPVFQCGNIVRHCCSYFCLPTPKVDLPPACTTSFTLSNPHSLSSDPSVFLPLCAASGNPPLLVLGEVKDRPQNDAVGHLNPCRRQSHFPF